MKSASTFLKILPHLPHLLVWLADPDGSVFSGTITLYDRWLLIAGRRGENWGCERVYVWALGEYVMLVLVSWVGVFFCSHIWLFRLVELNFWTHKIRIPFGGYLHIFQSPLLQSPQLLSFPPNVKKKRAEQPGLSGL